MSAITFYGGLNGANQFEREIVDRSGLRVSIGSHSVASALAAYSNIKKIGLLSPYFPAANEQVKNYLEEAGYSVIKDICLKCSRWTDIAKVTEEVMCQKIKDLNAAGVDALVQVGTNLPMAKLAATLEIDLGKPVIAINTATYWHALRANHIDDKIDGFGSLLVEY